MEEALGEALVGEVIESNGELVCVRFSECWERVRRWGRLWYWLLVQAPASKGSAGCMWTGRVEPQDALYGAVELVVREDGVRVFDLVHVWEARGVVKEGWLCLFLDVVVDLDGGAAAVFPCIKGVGSCECADGFDDIGKLCFGSIGLPWAGACMGSCVVCE